MLITPTHRLRPARRGVILLVVLALLTLFAIVGIMFVLVANSQETTARIAREAQQQTQPNFDAEQALAMYLGQLIYDVNDDANGINSSVRGQSLARLMYGYNPAVANDKAFSGPGRLHNPTSLPGLGSDEAYMVNYQYFQGANDGIGYRVPERPGTQATSLAGALAQPYTGGANIPYTYPDHQNFSLAYQDATTGQILVPSFQREYLFGRLDDAANPNWSNAAGKYLTARPRPQENPLFPLPPERGGDVKNLDGAPGGNDSIWTDPGFPVMTNADGRKYKVLVAPLILELDSRLNLNVAGNLVGNATTWPAKSVTNTTQVSNASTAASNQGWGPWEVNPAWVLNADGSGGGPSGTEWKNIFYGASPTGTYPGTSRAHVISHYGANRVPGDPLAWGNTTPRGWAPADYNGLDEKTGTTTATGYFLPGLGSNATYATFPLFPANRYGTGSIPPNPTDPAYPYPSEFFAHPRYYNAMRSAPMPTPGTSISDTRVLPIHAMHKLLRFGSTGGDFVTSDLLRLLPTNLVNDGNAPTRRNLVTLASYDIDRPGVTPYIWDATNAGTPTTAYAMNTALNPPYPQGGAIAFPPLSQRGSTPAGSEFDQASWRSLVAALGRINLNRTLTNFPPPDATGVSTNNTLALQALADRQQFALDIFTRLVQVTTGYTTPAAACNAAYQANSAATGGSPQYQALRYLAQLSANIVDYIDTDDQSTPFNWDPTNNGWVFGTETPRLLINEAYAQYDNSPATPVVVGNNNPPTYATNQPYNVNVWIELFNPMLADPVSATTKDTTARLQTNVTQSVNLYQVVLANYPAAQSVLANPANTTGNPNFQNTGTSNIYSTVTNFGPGGTATSDNTGTVQPFATPTMTATSGSNVGFYVLGPPSTGTASVFLSGNSPETPARTYAANPNLPVTYASPQMSYQPPAAQANQATTPTNQPANVAALPPPIILLQRLACPLLQPNNNPSSPSYNPYITIDSFAFQTPPAAGQAAQPNLPVVFDSRYFSATGPLTPTITVPGGGIQRAGQSYGRLQPFAGVTTQSTQVNYQQPAQQVPNQPANTFFSHNNPLNTFYWNTHLDRNLISPVELLFVHGARPMDLTAQFVTTSSTGVTTLNLARYAPWLDQASRLHRFLEIAETAPLSAGVNPWGRIPGRININGVWPSNASSPANTTRQSDVCNALCDAQSGNVFAAGDVTTVFNNMMKQRSPNVGVFSGSPTSPLGNSWNMPGPTDQLLVNAANQNGVGLTGVSGGQWQLDRPFWGNAPGYATGTDAMAQSDSLGRGLDNTLLRIAPGYTYSQASPGPRTFSVTNSTATHPYQQMELLNKIYNSTTTRSNVFAVYLTVGFFTVTNDPGTPVQIGTEVGRAENRQVRHRMFAIVDRSNLTNFTTTSTGAVSGPAAGTTVPQLQTLPVPTTGTNPNTGKAWALQPGMYLTFEPNTNNEETVIVQGNYQAAFYLTHGPGVTVINRGNPGPWLRYDPRQDGGVVPYFAIID